MKIGIIGSIWENIPPKKYGGTERVVYSLVEGLVNRGHDVTLFAAGTAKTSAKLDAIFPRPLVEEGYAWTGISYPLLHVTHAFDRINDFDMLHMHVNKSSDYLSFPLSVPVKNKVLFTLHFPYPLSHSKKEQRIDRHHVLQKYKFLNFTSISFAQRRGGENLNWIANVYNGISLSDYTFQDKPKGYYLWLGKFNPDKGVKEAILAAKKANVKLILAGKYETVDQIDAVYYQQEIKPLIDGKQIMYIGEVGGPKKDEIYGGAIAFLNPILWNEPFGLVMTESQATGTPVISFKNGAAQELIIDGKTGFLVNTVDEMAEKIHQVSKLKRGDCRDHIKKHFSDNQMVAEYENIYRHVLEHKKN